MLPIPGRDDPSGCVVTRRRGEANVEDQACLVKPASKRSTPRAGDAGGGGVREGESCMPLRALFIQQQDAAMSQGDLPRQGPLAAADHADSRDGVVGGPEGARRHDGGAPPRQAGDARDAGGLLRSRPAQRQQDGGEATRQPRRARPRRPDEQDVGDRTPVSPSASGPPLSVATAMPTPRLIAISGRRLPPLHLLAAVDRPRGRPSGMLVWIQIW